jgi:hypothetical protein
MTQARVAASPDKAGALNADQGAMPARRPPTDLRTAVIGNQAMIRRLASDQPSGPARAADLGRLQAKLRVGAVNDPLEREADAAADHVMRMAEPRVSLSSAPTLSRKCAGCEEEEQGLQREADGAGMAGAAAPPIVHDVLNSPGRPLDPATHDFMASRFGADFGDVRIHTDARAARSAAAVDALAYTVGRSIVFGSGRYDPDAQAGRHLLAHELAHVVQQNRAGTLSRLPLARKAEEGRALRWGRETTCSMWGIFAGVHEQGKGKKRKSETCCNSWPFALEDYAVKGRWAGAASCRSARQRQTATVAYDGQTVEVLCSDTIPDCKLPGATVKCPGAEEKIPADETHIIELSPAAMLALTGKLENLRSVSVTYSGQKEDLCLFGDAHTPRNPSAKRCLTRGCPPAEGAPTDNSSWPPR